MIVLRRKGIAIAFWIAAGLLFLCGTPFFASSPPPPSPATRDLLAAAKAGNRAQANDAIARGADVNGIGTGGMRPLHFVAVKGNADLAALLLDRGAKVDTPDDLGMTPLHAAAFEGKKEVAELLLRRGADPNAKDSAGYTPLQYALTNGKEEVAALLRATPERPAPKPAPRIITNDDIAGGGAESGAGFNPGGSKPYTPTPDFLTQYETPASAGDRYAYAASHLSMACKRKYDTLRERAEALRRRPSSYNEVDMDKVRRQIEQEEAFLRSLDAPAGDGPNTLRSQAGVAYRPGENLPEARYGVRLSEEASEAERQKKAARDEQVRQAHEKRLAELRNIEDRGGTLSPSVNQEIKAIEEEMARVISDCH